MKNVFDAMTSFSTERPKSTIAIIIGVYFLTWLLMQCSSILIIAKTLSFQTMKQFSLLNEVEDEYQASIDFIRFIDEIDSGDLVRGINLGTTCNLRSNID